MMVSLASGQTDTAGAKDYPGLSRMRGYYISSFDESPFDSYAFTITEGGQEKKQTIEGQRYTYRYDLKNNAPAASALQIIRNYQNAARAAGGKVSYEGGEGGDRSTTVHFAKGGSEVWLDVYAMSNVDKVILLTVVEKQAMQQDVTLDAAMAQGLDNVGSVAVYGIYFDTGKSEIKPESEPALTEIAKLLTQNAALKVLIVGHTDMVAGLASNMKLSQARAQAVVSELTTKHGIAAARMTPMGVGPCAPVTSNKTEDGRAKNRRVELVEIATQ